MEEEKPYDEAEAEPEEEETDKEAAKEPAARRRLWPSPPRPRPAPRLARRAGHARGRGPPQPAGRGTGSTPPPVRCSTRGRAPGETVLPVTDGDPAAAVGDPAPRVPAPDSLLRACTIAGVLIHWRRGRVRPLGARSGRGAHAHKPGDRALLARRQRQDDGEKARAINPAQRHRLGAQRHHGPWPRGQGRDRREASASSSATSRRTATSRQRVGRALRAGSEREAAEVACKLRISAREPIDPASQALAGDAGVVIIAGSDQI